MIKQNLSTKLLQKLSPQQIQLMKLLQVPTSILDIRIKEEMETNPALEEGDYAEEGNDFSKSETEDFTNQEGNDGESEEMTIPEEEFSFEDYINDFIDDDQSSYKLNSDNYNNEEEDRTIPVPLESTFHEYLIQQLGMINVPDARSETIAMQLIGSIDDDGYLRRDLEAIIDDVAFSQGVTTSEEELNFWLAKIQKFDPPGVGARDLRECLLLQLFMKYDVISEDSLFKMPLKNAIRIIENYFDEFTKKHYPRLQRQLSVTDEELKEAVDEILKLNPRPATGHATSSSRNSQYIIPDFTVVNREGDLELSLNTKNAPDLRVNDQYRDMLREYKQAYKGRRPDRKAKEAVLFIKQKIDSAKWFIDAIHQRHQTMTKTMESIMTYQKEFFMTGDEKRLRPMILKDIADMTGLDISTISRVANSKFVQTEYGTRKLKDFFSESLTTESGEEVSTLEVKKILTDIISVENKKKPLSDEKLKALLQNKGYNIARRTVAKYREQLNVPVARLRKEL